VAITAAAAPGKPTASESGPIALATGGPAGGTSATNGIEAGGEQEVSRHIWTLIEPVICVPVLSGTGASGARQTTVPSCSSTWSPAQAGTSVIVRTWGAWSGTNAPAGCQEEVASRVIRVAFGPPGFCVIA
jgi:hypothetical protein